MNLAHPSKTMPRGVNIVFDTIKKTHRLKNDSDLARFLAVHPPMISKLRKGTSPLSAAVIVRIHECTNMPIRAIRELAGEAVAGDR